MKSIKQIRDNLEVLSESVESATELRKISTLVRAGLFDSSKLTMLKRALNKDNVKMTKAERETLLDLLDKLLNLVTSNQQIYTKVKQSVSENVDVLDGSEYQELDEALTGSANDINKLPPLIIMRRRAIRIFPDGQKVALYWADKINKFISVPYESIGLSEESYADLYKDDEQKDKTAQIVNSLKKKKTDKIKKKIKDKESNFSKVKSAAQSISSAAGGGLQGIPAAIGGLAGAGLHNLAIAGAKKVFASKLASKKKLEEATEGQQMVKDYLFPVYSALQKIKTANMAGDKEAAKEAAKEGAIGMAVGGAMSRPIKGLTTGAKMATTAAKKTVAKKTAPIVAKDAESSFTKALEKKGAEVKPPKPKPSAAKSAFGTGLKTAGKVGGALTAAALSGLTGSGAGSNKPPAARGNYAVNRGTSTYNPFSTYRERQFAKGAIAQEEMSPVPKRNPFSSARRRALSVSMVKENTLFDKLKTISESTENHTHVFEDGSVDITPIMASKLLETYSKLNAKNKQSIQEMINKDKNSFTKVAKFSAGK